MNTNMLTTHPTPICNHFTTTLVDCQLANAPAPQGQGPKAELGFYIKRSEVVHCKYTDTHPAPLCVGAFAFRRNPLIFIMSCRP